MGNLDPKMNRLKILNNKKIRHIKNLILDQWGASFETDMVFLENEKGKIYIVSSDFAEIDITRLNLDGIGIYFAEIKADEIRLSIEGSQMIGPSAKKNIVELDDAEVKQWLKGTDIETELKAEGFVIIKNRDDFLGTGKYSSLQKKIFNYVPKGRRVNVID